MTEVKAVIGANFGDEGKGLMTDYFANKFITDNKKCIVVCSNGGAQRGHTVVTPSGTRHVFHHFGSGTLTGADTYLPEYYVANPMIFMEEYQTLKDKNINIFVNPNCLCTTPYDMMLNQIIEESRGDNKHGSCGVGVWETIVRNGFTFGGMLKMKDKELRLHLRQIRTRYLEYRLRQEGLRRPDDWRDLILSNKLLEHYISDLREMQSKIRIADNNILRKYTGIVFENGQGLLLDQNIYDKDHSTPSNTGSTNIYEILSSTFNDYNLEVCYVSRSYLTRHGNGPMESECDPEEINPMIYDHTNVWNKHQGYIRYGKLNINNMFVRAEEDFLRYWDNNCKMSFAITHLNEYMIDEKKYTGRNIYKSYGETRDDIYH